MYFAGRLRCMFVVRRRALKDVAGVIESSVGVTGEAGWREKGWTIID